MQTHVTMWRHGVAFAYRSGSTRSVIQALRIPAIGAAFACLVGSLSAQPPQEPAPPLRPSVRLSEPETQLEMVEKSARRVELEDRIEIVQGFDPQVVDVTPVNKRPKQIRLHALAPGVTTVVLRDEKDQKFELEVFVTGDVRHLQAYIRKLFPKSSVQVVAMPSKTDGSVLLRGWVAQPEHINEVYEVAQQFYPNVINQMQFGGVQQVLLRVKVMEVQRSKIRRLGLNFLYLNEDGFLSSTPGSLTPLSELSLPFGGPPGISVLTDTLGDTSAAFGIVEDDQIFQGFLDALREERLLKILAEPELVTTNGRPANMLAGGEFPILVPQSLGTVTIEYREFGVQLEAVPIMLGNGRVRLELQPSVSERDFTTAVQVSGTVVPGVTTRRVNTQVEMNFGETFIIAGLISNQQDANTQKIPFFGELPWIGAAFRRVNHEQDETELVIMVTPELAGPLDPRQVPPGGPGLFTDGPTDRELFRDGFLEVPSYGDRCEGCGLRGPSVMQPYHSHSPTEHGAGKAPLNPGLGASPGANPGQFPGARGQGMMPTSDRHGAKGQPTQPRISPSGPDSDPKKESTTGTSPPPMPSTGNATGAHLDSDPFAPSTSDPQAERPHREPKGVARVGSSGRSGSSSSAAGDRRPSAGRAGGLIPPAMVPTEAATGKKRTSGGTAKWSKSGSARRWDRKSFQPPRFKTRKLESSDISQSGLIEPKPGLIAPSTDER